MKVKELKQAYQKTKEANGHSGSEPYTCYFYDQLHGILGRDPTTTPPLSVDTCKGGVSHNREEDFVDEEEEEEEEENAQQASGESTLPGSQDLFFNLEPIPSQGTIPNPEAREGSSALRVSDIAAGPALQFWPPQAVKKTAAVDGKRKNLPPICHCGRKGEKLPPICHRSGRHREAVAELPPWPEELPPLSNCRPKHLLGTLVPGACPVP
ncbi:hypothetical protein UY3_01856 [Chelonia mydas]|uniref:Uncharacterized protein n=1 Tax=Chelonia mydas TaxID=8469 RepID=M7BYG6_CHEMY|nr:hypothetical protein UY3_01856 [Chelonia mydas]